MKTKLKKIGIGVGAGVGAIAFGIGFKLIKKSPGKKEEGLLDYEIAIDTEEEISNFFYNENESDKYEEEVTTYTVTEFHICDECEGTGSTTCPCGGNNINCQSCAGSGQTFCYTCEDGGWVESDSFQIDENEIDNYEDRDDIKYEIEEN